MNKKGNKNNKQNPWDEINYIYDKDALFNKDKIKEKKVDFFYLLNVENKKEKATIDLKTKNKINSDKQIEKIKSTLNNYNQFMVDHKKKYLNKTHLEKGLSLMGLNTVTIFPSVLNVKGNKIPAELVMKSITEDFANNFGKELNKRLDILKEMHKEQVRHNEVSENFFASAIGFLATIAKNTGNIQMSNTLDNMIKQVTAL